MTTNVTNTVAINQLRIKCSTEVQEMMSLFRDLSPRQFNVEDVMSFRSKKIFAGKCTWTVFYTPLPGVLIDSKEQYRKAVDQIKDYKPFESKVVISGRVGASSYGIFVCYGCQLCTCVQDFRLDLTLFCLEQRSKYTVVSDVLVGDDDDDDNHYEHIDRELEILYTVPPNTILDILLTFQPNVINLEVFMDKMFANVFSIFEKTIALCQKFGRCSCEKGGESHQ
ncbi:hypothetical protein HA402_002125 [Bradysia odoriphaga]|nr:hypothetical protein HA402_002125 [Bradysia odoriphaga]